MLRLLGWNALLLLVGVVLIAMAGEAYFRLYHPLAMPFRRSNPYPVAVPNVGFLWPPNTEFRSTNELDYWNVSRTNSLGFLDREPPSPDRAAATCHISMIGDSFVQAVEIPIDDKFHVRLEELAADELPHLDITTSAFGMGNTGQVQQLPFYDEYARLLHPKLIVLVFVDNDFTNNTPVLRAVDRGQVLEPTVERRSDGKLALAWSRPQDRLPLSPGPSWADRAMNPAMRKAAERSRLVSWLRAKKRALRKALFRVEPGQSRFVRNVGTMGRQPGYAALLEGWRPTTRHEMYRTFARRDLPPFFEDALQYTRFALEQFRQRADRDGFRLVILASHTVTIHGSRPMFERLSQMAATLDIPVIDQADYILRQGARLSDARWPHDWHWSPAGHRWAAEALLEYLEEHPATCDRPTGAAALLEPAP